MTAASTPGHHADPLHVVAAILRDARGRILLARRTEGRDLAGLWEFPGGKVDAGETPEAALVRELHEELGIDVTVGDALIEVPQQYPHKRLRLDVRHVRGWQGRVHGREGQALAWVPPAQLTRYDMPPADRPVVAALLQPDRVLVTPDPGDPETWLAALSRALQAGVARVQLRAGAEARMRLDWPALAARAVQACRRAGADVAINGDPRLARELGAGLHLRGDQLATLAERAVDDTVMLSASCHTRADLERAEALGCAYALLGTVGATPSHPDGPLLGWDGVRALREHVALPIYGIGGLAPADIPHARRHGAQGIAAIRSLWPATP